MKLNNTQAQTLVCALLTWKVGKTDSMADQDRLDRELGFLNDEMSDEDIDMLIEHIQHRGEL